jgi:hypothetical protein
VSTFSQSAKVETLYGSTNNFSLHHGHQSKITWVFTNSEAESKQWYDLYMTTGDEACEINKRWGHLEMTGRQAPITGSVIWRGYYTWDDSDEQPVCKTVLRETFYCVS